MAGTAALLWSLLVATPSLACLGSRLSGDTLTASEAGDVFSGTVIRQLEPFAWTFMVDDVRQGDASRWITVTSGPLCGPEFELGRRYLVHTEPGDWGSMVVSFGQWDELEPLGDSPLLEFALMRLHPITPTTIAAVLVIGVGGAWIMRSSRGERPLPNA